MPENAPSVRTRRKKEYRCEGVNAITPKISDIHEKIESRREGGGDDVTLVPTIARKNLRIKPLSPVNQTSPL
jgi:hypothetical protein